MTLEDFPATLIVLKRNYVKVLRKIRRANTALLYATIEKKQIRKAMKEIGHEED